VLALAPADRHFLEDLYFEVLRYTDKEGAAKWLDRFETEERDFPRKGYWRIARVDFRLYDLEDLDGARRLADGIRASADPETTVRAAIRQGDVERFRGKYDEAAKLYAQAQDMPRAAPRQATAPTARPREEAAKPKGPAEKPKAGADGPSRERPAVTGAISLPATREPWKAEAVRESSYYRTAHDLIGKGCLYEARDVLRRWELELPLSKISGDYSLAEAEYFRTIRDFRRALKILRAYREGTEMSAFLADAMEMEIQCLVQLGRDKEIVELAKEFERRFPGHPAAERARSLSGIVKGQASTETPGPAIVEKP
jgi:TolA-binding protein